MPVATPRRDSAVARRSPVLDVDPPARAEPPSPAPIPSAGRAAPRRWGRPSSATLPARPARTAASAVAARAPAPDGCTARTSLPASPSAAVQRDGRARPASSGATPPAVAAQSVPSGPDARAPDRAQPPVYRARRGARVRRGGGEDGRSRAAAVAPGRIKARRQARQPRRSQAAARVGPFLQCGSYRTSRSRLTSVRSCAPSSRTTVIE